ncbi:Longin-like domain-containing protein [Aspergillus aurantiobrunneus]
MKIVYIGVLRNAQPEAIELCCERELSSYSRFTRGSISEFTTMFSKLVTSRTSPGQRQDVQEKEFTFHVYASSQSPGITGVIISDDEYPSMAAHQILSKLLDEFTTKNPSVATSTGPVSFPELRTYITNYQDPQNVGSILKIQQELDETKVVLHKTIESVLERGEKLDDLVQKSEGLSSQSKMFYTSAKKQNSCCIIM